MCTMYYVKPVIQFRNPIPLPPDIYYMPNLCSFEKQSPNVEFLENLQDKVLSKLYALLNDINSLSKNGDVNLTKTPIDINKLKEVQDNVLSRLERISSTVEKISQNANIALTVSSKPLSVSELADRQNEINRRLNNLQIEINELASKNKVDLNINVKNGKTVRNVTIFCRDSKPPLSVILCLKMMRKRGLRVACQCYCKTKNGNASDGDETVKIYRKLLEYLRSVNLAVEDARGTYDVIVSIMLLSDAKNQDYINDFVSQDNVLDEVPMIGEMVVLMHLCSALGFDMRSVLDQIVSVNDDLLYKRNVKSALCLVNNRLIIDEINNVDSMCVSVMWAFVVSALIKCFGDGGESAVMEKVTKTANAKVDIVLKECDTNMTSLLNLINH